MTEIEPGRALDSPVIERRADRLGVLEAGDRVAAEAAQPRDGLFAQIKQLLFGLELAWRRTSSTSLSDTATDLPSGFLKLPLLET